MRTSLRILFGTLAAVVFCRAVTEAFAAYNAQAIALLPVIDDLNHDMHPNVSCCHQKPIPDAIPFSQGRVDVWAHLDVPANSARQAAVHKSMSISS